MKIAKNILLAGIGLINPGLAILGSWVDYIVNGSKTIIPAIISTISSSIIPIFDLKPLTSFGVDIAVSTIVDDICDNLLSNKNILVNCTSCKKLTSKYTVYENTLLCPTCQSEALHNHVHGKTLLYLPDNLLKYKNDFNFNFTHNFNFDFSNNFNFNFNNSNK